MTHQNHLVEHHQSSVVADDVTETGFVTELLEMENLRAKKKRTEKAMQPYF